MTNEQKTSKTKIVREIKSITFAHRVGQPGTYDTDLEFFTANDCDFRPENHAMLGPGVWCRFRNRKGAAKFVPISNIRGIDYTETEREDQ